MAQAKFAQVQSAAPAAKKNAAVAAAKSLTVQELVDLATILSNEQTSIQDIKPMLEAILQTRLKGGLPESVNNDDLIKVCVALIEKLSPRRNFFSKEVSFAHRFESSLKT